MCSMPASFGVSRGKKDDVATRRRGLNSDPSLRAATKLDKSAAADHLATHFKLAPFSPIPTRSKSQFNTPGSLCKEPGPGKDRLHVCTC